MRKGKFVWSSEDDNNWYEIKLYQLGYDSFTVQYGQQVKTQLTYRQAAEELGACIMHALACESKMDTPKTVE